MTERDLKRLAGAVQDRRAELGLSQEDFARRGPLGLKTVQRIEKGTINPHAPTLGKLDNAAGWTPGSSRTVLGGGNPTLKGASSRLEQELRQIRDAVANKSITPEFATRLEEKVRRDYEPLRESGEEDTNGRFGRRHA